MNRPGIGHRLGIGIDFGTSNSSVALYDGKRILYAPVEPSPGSESESAAPPESESAAPAEAAPGQRRASRRDAKQAAGSVMPTALYLDRSYTATVGQGAVDRYLRDNAGRLVELTRERLGELEMTVAATDTTPAPLAGDAITVVAQVHALTDRELPGRLFRSLKRWLADPGVDRVRVFERRYRLVALITPILAHMRECAEKAGAERSTPIYVGRPIAFEGGAKGQARAAERLLEACGYAAPAQAGGVRLYPEPVAAVLSYLRAAAPEPGRVLLSFDFGGGTLDLCALRTRRDGFDVLGTHGIGLGGDAIDRLIYRHVVFPEIGEGCPVPSQVVSAAGSAPAHVPFAFRDIGERLLNWQLAYELNTSATRESILRGMRAGPEARRRLGRLYDLITRNQTYRVLRAVERAKVELSSAELAWIEVPELELRISLSRSQFDEIIADALVDVEHAIAATLARCALGAEEIDAVVCTGGSARIPAVRDCLARRLRAPLVEHDTFTSIAAGLAIASYHGDRQEVGD